MTIRVAELFAGVGGFRLALDGYDDESHGWHLPAAGSYETIWLINGSLPEPPRSNLPPTATSFVLARTRW